MLDDDGRLVEIDGELYFLVVVLSTWRQVELPSHSFAVLNISEECPFVVN